MNTPCILWQGCLSSKRYGCRTVNGKRVYAHRHAYEQHHGPIGAGLVIDHLCGNTLCVNPDHLEAVEQITNVRRSGKVKLSAATVAIIRASNGRSIELAKRFGVSQRLIQMVRSGARWADS